MHANFQPHLAFHLGGMRPSPLLESVAELDLRPAFLAGYRDLTKLRYDFPVVLVHGREDESAVKSLSDLFDEALQRVVPIDDRIRHQSLRIEREIRRLAATRSGGALDDLWNAATSSISLRSEQELRASVAQLRAALPIEGEVLDCDGAMPFRLLRHIWKAVYHKKARRFRGIIEGLIARLNEILYADLAHSKKGLSPQKLKAGMGQAFASKFDFGALSQLLQEMAPMSSLSESRKRRIRSLLKVLRSQRFYSLDDQNQAMAGGLYSFIFQSCARATVAYRERLPRMIEVTKAIAMAELEVTGAYSESTHNAFFAEFDAGRLEPRDVDLFPDYLVCIRAADMGAAESEAILQACSAGLPVKVLLQTDDILDLSAVGSENLSSGSNRHLARMVIALGSSYVLQSSASNLVQYGDRLFRGLSRSGPALFSVFSGAAPQAALSPYLNSAAAMESRAFPAFVYDPSAGPEWACRFDLGGNPQVERQWPLHELAYEDGRHQRITESLAFTFADFLACDRRYSSHFARVSDRQENDEMQPIADFLREEPACRSDQVPYVWMVDPQDVLQTVIVEEKLVREARRCAATWRTLQDLGGINHPHAAGLLEKTALASQSKPLPERSATDEAVQAVTSAAEPVASEPSSETCSDDPYIETPRCTTCNECIQINDKMFGYDANKQASIINARAGTYRQLVEAAESCQVSIIHPGKPRNLSEPDLDELMQRAQPYL